MSTCCNKNTEYIRNGTGQEQREIKALSPDSVELLDLTIEDWMSFAYNFAKQVGYFSAENREAGNWQGFFANRDQVSNVLAEMAKNHELSPHLTLFVCFLCLLRRSQKRLNGLTKRHLDFYYKKVLKLANKPATPDNVHVLFELAKNAGSVKIEKGTKLNAGRDKNGNNLEFRTSEEIVLNHAKIASLKNLYLIENDYLGCSEIANSYDGEGKSFPDDDIKWWPFGHTYFDKKKVADESKEDFIDKKLPRMPDARTGFAIASPVLNLEKGKRVVTFKITLNEPVQEKYNTYEIEKALTVYFSGKKTWIDSEYNSEEQSYIEDYIINIVVIVPANADEVVNYNKDKLGENYNTTFPIARFLINNGENDPNKDGFKLNKLLAGKTITGIDIDIDVSEIIDAEIENDHGKLDSTKPFFPFGAIPTVGSGFRIKCNEAINKNLTEIGVELCWKNTPQSNFEEHYKAYLTKFQSNLSKQTYDLEAERSDVSTVQRVLGRELSSTEAKVENAVSTNLVTSNDDFTADVELWIKNKKENSGSTDSKLFNGSFEEGYKGLFQTKINNSTSKINLNSVKSEKSVLETDKTGFLKIVLKKSFYHDLYPRILAIAMSKKDDNTLIPNPPYTPQVESFSLSYKASVSQKYTFNSSLSDIENEELFTKSEIELYHENPFGQSLQHSYLKNQHDFLASDNNIACKLLPNYSGGELYIALENAEALQSVSILIQVIEGSEYPQAENIYSDNEKLQWYILCSDEWKPLNKDYITYDNTENFLKSGIVKLTIPREATKSNYSIPGDYYWLRVLNIKDYNAVCQVVNIQSQAVLAQFFDNDNELSHLKSGIEAKTISKLTERIATVKKVEQPHNSFDGKLPESDSDFYKRVSERLRHKQRAITAWDYEHLILQKFPNIYKANCLSHTSKNCEIDPGFVTVIVIPNIQKKNVFDVYKPCISKAKLNEIKDYINRINTLHVNTTIENPEYEEVKVELSVKFYKGYDENYYQKQLKKDIAKFLAPWAFKKTASIDFGTSLHESTMVHFIENLEYVDYISNFDMLKLVSSNNQDQDRFKKFTTLTPSNVKTILTSVKYDEHEVKPISKTESS